MRKKTAFALLTAMIAAAALYGCSVKKEAVRDTDAAFTQAAVPKYVFLFIGDGMSYPQIQLTNYYVNAKEGEEDILTSKNALNMIKFPIAGSAQTYDSTSFAPDSASSATAIATGRKTWSGSINVSEDFSEQYETIAEKLKAQKDYKIGILSTVNLNHATPAAFYAHQESRNNYYEIGLELIESGFDYFAGGALNNSTGTEKNQEDLYQMAEAAGYQVLKTQEEAKALKAEDGKALVIGEHLTDDSAMTYEIDRKEGEWALADYVEKGIEVLDNDKGFFMMTEGGKIDKACHANDAVSAIKDVIALDEAIAEAVEFYKEHPGETLIIVTGDHETGGLTIGFAGTGYDVTLKNFEKQKISYAKFNSDYISRYKKNETDFDTVMKDVTELFGLQIPAEQQTALTLTPYEYEQLKTAYNMTMSKTEREAFGQEEYVKYGSHEPLTVTITHLLNNKSGINFSSYAHTGLPVEVLAQGVGAESFQGYYDNTAIYEKMAALLGIR